MDQNIFHEIDVSKLWFLGGTTLVYLLDKLSKINDFTLNKVEPARIDGDKMPYEKPLVEEGFQNSAKAASWLAKRLLVRAPWWGPPSTDGLFKNLLKFLREEKTEPYMLLKHHFYFDFRKHGLRQPTMINVIRDPVDWFVSQYYFRRYGWNRKRNE